jgi:hypothetical protein
MSERKLILSVGIENRTRKKQFQTIVKSIAVGDASFVSTVTGDLA